MIAIIIGIALPPLPGVGLMLYSTMFAQMGIPIEAVMLASLLELFIEYVNTGSNVLMLLLELTRDAAKMNRLNREVWKRDKAEPGGLSYWFFVRLKRECLHMLSAEYVCGQEKT